MPKPVPFCFLLFRLLPHVPYADLLLSDIVAAEVAERHLLFPHPAHPLVIAGDGPQSQHMENAHLAESGSRDVHTVSARSGGGIEDIVRIFGEKGVPH